MRANIRLNLPNSLWTANDSAKLGLNTLAAIKLRTSKGIDADGNKFAKYSRAPIYIPFRGARLKPKGGRLSRTGQSVYYADGYDQYKRESRQEAGSSALVDLVLSGALMNNLVLLSADAQRFIIGLTQHVQSYGYKVNADREYLGLSPRDVNVLVSAVQAELTKKIKRGAR